MIYQLLVGRQMPIGCLGAVCFTANLWLKRQNHPESPAKSTGTNAGSRPDMSARITRVKWITRIGENQKNGLFDGHEPPRDAISGLKLAADRPSRAPRPRAEDDSDLQPKFRPWRSCCEKCRLAPMNKDAQGRWKVGMSNTKLKMRAQSSATSWRCSRRCSTAGRKSSLRTVLPPSRPTTAVVASPNRNASRGWRKRSRSRMKFWPS